MTKINNKLTVAEIREYLNDAREISKGLTGHVANTTLPKFHETMKKIGQDPTLTAQGQFEKKEKFRKQQEVLLLSEIAEAKETYNLLLSDAQASAEAILLSDVEKPDETAIKLFKLEKNRLQSAVMFAPTADAKAKALTEFAKLGDKGQYFAREIQGEFIGLSQQAMAGVADPQALANLTRSLGRVNASLQAAAFTEDQREAGELLNSVTAYQSGDFVNTIVLGDSLMTISKVTHDYANNLEGYQVDHADTIEEVNRLKRYENPIK
ncbi:hypothetical protein JFU03_05765 [Bacillus sp. TH44]|uniref:hypothetical protein n=1 Tax=unclassified Bacillus (in: firmicutes) TaxID=185979 RepID=UPI0019126D4C|nr:MULTISPECIES: hypothetical protein [unclassified Bacillus (in: firmicutes)]MBK5349134.1 hypothetical protein [Bacillus sp. TH45]MBK5357830.1 hypothetical protein [Bacillus sp. TH44]MBK5363963.1 hypothetical protein [Bacillus sp. TH50]